MAQTNLLKEIRRDLKGANTARLREIAKKTGVPLNTIWRVVTGYSPTPAYQTVLKMSRYRRDWKVN